MVKSSKREAKDALNTDENQLIKAKLRDNSAGEKQDSKYHLLPGFLWAAGLKSWLFTARGTVDEGTCG